MSFLARFVSWWAGVSALLASVGTCPCGGGAPCPRGVALVGFVTACGALALRSKTPKPTEGAKFSHLSEQSK